MADKDESAQRDDMIGRLIAEAGRGPAPNAEARSRIYTAVRARWEEERSRESGTRSTQRRPIWSLRAVAMAATVAAVAILILLESDPWDGGAIELARFSHIAGDVELTRGGEARALESSESAGMILAGDVLRTGDDGQAALRWDDGASLRINVATELRFVERNEVDLLAGTVYVDSGEGVVSSQALEVQTPLGRVRHIGTQYEVHLGESSLRIRVREGSVAISGESVDAVGVAGEQIDVESDGLASRSAIAPDDAAWEWATSLARLPEMSEYRLDETLAWIARERGLMLEYSTPAVRSRVSDEVVLGLEGFDPFDAIGVLERTANVQIQIDGVRLIVSEQ